MRNKLAELLLIWACYIADRDSLRGENLCWSVFQYFARFRDAPSSKMFSKPFVINFRWTRLLRS